MRILAHRRYVPGQPPGPSVIEAIGAEIEAVRDDPSAEPSEWHFALAITKAVDAAGLFYVFLPAPPADPAATTLGFKFERIDVLPAAAIADVAAMLRAAD